MFNYCHTSSGSVHWVVSSQFFLLFFFSDDLIDRMSGAAWLYWIFILGVCAFIVAGVAGACAGQSLPCPVPRRPPEAGQPPVVPPQQQCVQLAGPHRKLLRQDTCVSPHNTQFVLHHFVRLWAVVETLLPSSVQPHITTACPWTTPCSASLPTSPLGLKRATWPTTWATKQQHTKGITPTKVSQSAYRSEVHTLKSLQQNLSKFMRTKRWESQKIVSLKEKRSRTWEFGEILSFQFVPNLY